jgi:hypothetical protein
MADLVLSNFQMEWFAFLRLLLSGLFRCFDCHKTRNALAVSNQELVRTRAELKSCQTSNRLLLGLGFLTFVLFAVFIIAGRRG